MQKKLPEDIVSSMKGNETWHDCPQCGKSWKDTIATPGLIHKTIICDECWFKNYFDADYHAYEILRKKKYEM